MEIDSEQRLIYFFISLKDILLTLDTDCIDNLFARQYNENIQELGKIWNLNLTPYLLEKSEDEYISMEDIEFPKITGFAPISDSTTNTFFTKEEKKFKKLNLLLKLNQVLFIINEKIKKYGNSKDN